MIRRHRARRLALQALCCIDVQGREAAEGVGEFIADSREPPETIDAARGLLEGVLADRDACDLLLARHARRWNLERLALVDRNILRLAVHELRAGTVPFKVVITEALKLAQEFSTAESPRFVNGVLDAVAHEIAGTAQEAGPAQEADPAPGPAEDGAE